LIEAGRAEAILDRFQGRRLIVLGDLMLDEFIWGEVRRISPEAPVPVVEVRRETLQLGGAGNVVTNLLALGAEAIPIGILGEDEAGRRMRALFADEGASVEGLLTVPDRPTTRKTRIVAHSQQMVRADREDRSLISEAIERQILALYLAALPSADAVILSDYDKGLLTPALLQSAIRAARAAGKPICLDPKIRHFSHYRLVDVVTPNQIEAERASGIEITDPASLLQAASRIRDLLDCRHVLITRGELGMSLFDAGGTISHIPTTAREVYDVTGAGDTVIATLTLALAAGAPLLDAAILANLAAGVVVGKVGTAAVSQDELRATLRRFSSPRG
jgi:D-beta-D-heptose 7-phosphate kinase/D-beta-D-heptose 1-phosphate adenosyltransferase